MSKLLLDTNVLLWLGRGALRTDVVAALNNADLVAVSAVTALEIALKQNIGKLRLQVADVLGDVRDRGFHLISITPEQAWLAGSLPLHHRDPFDRLLVAQAQLDGYTIVTGDTQLAQYGVATLAA